MGIYINIVFIIISDEKWEMGKSGSSGRREMVEEKGVVDEDINYYDVEVEVFWGGDEE